MKCWGYKDTVLCIPTADHFVAGTYEIITQSMHEEKASRHASVMRGAVLKHALVDPDSQRLCSLLPESMFASAPFSHQVTWPKAARGIGLRECESPWVATFRMQREILKGGSPQTSFLSPYMGLFYKLRTRKSWLAKPVLTLGFFHLRQSFCK